MPPADERSCEVAGSSLARRVAALVGTVAAAATLVLLPAAAGASDNRGPGGAAAPIDASHSGGAAPTTPVPHRSRGGRRNRRARTTRTPVIAHVSCVPHALCGANPHMVTAGGRLAISGTGVAVGTRIVFAAPRASRRHHGRSRRSRPPVAYVHHSALGLVVAVPHASVSGRIYAVAHGRRSRPYGPIAVVRRRLHPPPPPKPSHPLGTSGATGPTGVVASPFDGQGMWIWYISKSAGGDLAAIIAQAHASGVTTLFVKSSDGSANYWSQFSPTLVQTLHAGGLKVCAWQYVYGTQPVAEADLGAQAVANGADCLVIDAESQYEGRYAAAQQYITELRARVGPTYPVGLASFPYTWFHPSFPYSVFLGPGGAQFNAPQMYWKDIGQSVDTVYANTWIHNRIYERPVYPLGQTYGGVSPSDVLRFREEGVDYGARGWSFWDYQETPASGWAALAAPLAPLTSVTPNSTWPTLTQGDKGDDVLWMQEHLAAAVPTQPTSGIFDATTAANLAAFQTAHGIPASGVTDAATWPALLALTPITVDWTGASAARARR